MAAENHLSLITTIPVLIVGWSAYSEPRKEEEDAEHPDQRTDFAMSSGAELNESEGKETEAEARGDSERPLVCHSLKTESCGTPRASATPTHYFRIADHRLAICIGTEAPVLACEVID
jgi:hypothetical protein